MTTEHASFSQLYIELTAEKIQSESFMSSGFCVFVFHVDGFSAKTRRLQPLCQSTSAKNQFESFFPFFVFVFSLRKYLLPLQTA
jgi:hypothetical protein